MIRSDSPATQPGRSHPILDSILPVLLPVAFLVAYAPMFGSLIRGPWQTEQESHGPLIIAASAWLVWQSRERIRAATIAARPTLGWAMLLFGLTLMFLARTQGVLAAEVLSAIIVIGACVLLLAGVAVLRILLFPLGFLLFAVPLPDWLVDAATVPLKVFISNGVTRLLHQVGYPIAQDGVMIVIGPYEVLVKDACSGMNSVFALSAIGVFYVHVLRSRQKIRGLLLLIATVPIAVASNFMRVLSLVLIAYYGGVDRLQGALHGLTGFALFAVAVVFFCVFDAILGAGIAWLRRFDPRGERVVQR
jgi:exosortase